MLSEFSLCLLSKFVPPAMPGGKFIRGLLASLAQRYGRHTASVVVSKYVKDPELQALLAGGQLIDWNLSPAKVERRAFTRILVAHPWNDSWQLKAATLALYHAC